MKFQNSCRARLKMKTETRQKPPRRGIIEFKFIPDSTSPYDVQNRQKMNVSNIKMIISPDFIISYIFLAMISQMTSSMLTKDSLGTILQLHNDNFSPGLDVAFLSQVRRTDILLRNKFLSLYLSLSGNVALCNEKLDV